MKPARVNCENCSNFEPLVLEDENLIGKIFSKAKCKLGKRVMFRLPNMSMVGYPFNSGGYFRYCAEFKNKM
jgi:hypothetical protein